MAYKIAQFRFYGNGNAKNYYPSEVSEDIRPEDMGDYLTKGTIFNNFTPIMKIVIESSKDVRICFNENLYVVTIYKNQLFSLEPSSNSSLIYKINFCREDLSNLGESDYLIINIVYEVEEEKEEE